MRAGVSPMRRFVSSRRVLARLRWKHLCFSAMSHNINRREAIAALASATLVPLMAACRREPGQPPPSTTTEADALALLDEIANNFLRLSPESATSLGIDTGTRSSLRSQLSDRSAQGQQQKCFRARLTSF